jgi:hypothetical protein
MTDQTPPIAPAKIVSAGTPRSAYTTPRLTTYGTVQGLTHGVGDVNGVSGTPDGE